VKRLGVLMLDAKKYHIKDIAVSLEEISAQIYARETDSNSGAVGELTLKLFEKPGRDIWAGNMVIGDKAYNLYLLGVGRKFGLAEVTEKLADYCASNPEDSKCSRIAIGCAADTESCRTRVKAYCQENSSDLKCLQLKKVYCLKNASDERCRDYLKGLCEANPNQAHCRIKTVNNERVIGISTDAVSEATEEEGELRNKLVVKKARPTLTRAKNLVTDQEGQ